MKLIREALTYFKRLLRSHDTRLARLEAHVEAGQRETQRKLDVLISRIPAFTVETVRELDNLPETADSVRRHDEWIRAEQAKQRGKNPH